MTVTSPALVTPAPGPARPGVVLLHSSAASARQWDLLAASLQPACEVHAVDLHGHGLQAAWRGSRPLSVHDEAALVLPRIEAAGGAHLIGHSYGAAIAVHLAVARPALVHSLAVYEPVLFGLLAEHDPDSAAAREAFDLGAGMRTLVARGQADTAAQRFVDYWSGAPVWQQMGPQRQRALALRMPVVVQHFDVLYGEPLPAARLARLRMPMLCLSGGRSTAAALHIAGLLRRLLPGAGHETLAGLGHLGPITDPMPVNQRLLRFLGLASPSLRAAEMALA